MGDSRSANSVLWKNLQERVRLDDLGVDERILKSISNWMDMCNVSISRKGAVSGSATCRKGGKFLE
jgi:hypothetical protein